MSDPTIDDVRRYLSELPELCALLPDALVTRTAGVQTSRPTPSSRPPTKLDVLHLMDESPKDTLGEEYTGKRYPDPDRVGVLPYLWSWVRDIESEAMDMRPQLPDELPEQPTVSNACAWLLEELEWAATLPQWDEMAYGVRSTWQAVRSAVSSVADKPERKVPCGRCELPLTPIEGTRPMWECPSGHVTSVQAVTLKQAARIIGIRNERLQAYANRNLLQRVKDGSKILYDLSSIRAIVAEERLRVG